MSYRTAFGREAMGDSVMPSERPDRLEEACAVFGVYAPGVVVYLMSCFVL